MGGYTVEVLGESIRKSPIEEVSEIVKETELMRVIEMNH